MPTLETPKNIEVFQKELDKVSKLLGEVNEAVKAVKESKTLNEQQKAEKLRAINKVIEEQIIKPLASWRGKVAGQTAKDLEGALKALRAKVGRYETDAKALEKAQASAETAQSAVASPEALDIARGDKIVFKVGSQTKEWREFEEKAEKESKLTLYSELGTKGLIVDNKLITVGPVEKTEIAEFNKKIEKGTSVIVLSAMHCTACELLKPFFKKASGKFTELKLGYIYTDSSGGLATTRHIKDKYNGGEDFESFPVILVFKNGKLIEKKNGIEDFNLVYKKLDDYRKEVDIRKSQEGVDQKLRSLIKGQETMPQTDDARNKANTKLEKIKADL